MKQKRFIVVGAGSNLETRGTALKKARKYARDNSKWADTTYYICEVITEVVGKKAPIPATTVVVRKF